MMIIGFDKRWGGGGEKNTQSKAQAQSHMILVHWKKKASIKVNDHDLVNFFSIYFALWNKYFA